MMTAYQANHDAHDLSRRCAVAGVDRLSPSLFDAGVDLTPNQIEAGLFALRSLLQPSVLQPGQAMRRAPTRHEKLRLNAALLQHVPLRLHSLSSRVCERPTDQQDLQHKPVISHPVELVTKLCDRPAVKPADNDCDLAHVCGVYSLAVALPQTVEPGRAACVLTLPQTEPEFQEQTLSMGVSE